MPNALNTNWGYINLYQATANSVNTVFMDVNKHLGAANLAKIAHQAGIEGDIAEDTTYNILGINGITVWDLAQGHSTIANDGVKNTLHIVDKVLTSDGSKELYKTAQENQQVFDANDCHLVQKAMQGTTTYGTAAGVSARLGRQVAGKSGTANDEKAASFVAIRRNCSMCGPFGILRKTAARRKCHRSQAMAFPPPAIRRICSRSSCRSHCRIRRC